MMVKYRLHFRRDLVRLAYALDEAGVDGFSGSNVSSGPYEPELDLEEELEDK